MEALRSVVSRPICWQPHDTKAKEDYTSEHSGEENGWLEREVSKLIHRQCLTTRTYHMKSVYVVWIFLYRDVGFAVTQNSLLLPANF